MPWHRLGARSAGVVAASHEDYGLTPLEAVAFGKPAAVWRHGGIGAGRSAVRMSVRFVIVVPFPGLLVAGGCAREVTADTAFV